MTSSPLLSDSRQAACACWQCLSDLVEVLAPASDHQLAAGHVSASQIATRVLDLVDAVLLLDGALQDFSVLKALQTADQEKMDFLSSFRSPAHTEGLCNVALGVVMGVVFVVDPQRLDDDTMSPTITHAFLVERLSQKDVIQQMGDAIEIALHGIDLKRLSAAIENEFQRAARPNQRQTQRT